MDGQLPLASGRDADVYALDAHRVLRRYRNGADVTAESKVMGYVTELGFPVPVVYSASGADLVMERVHGPTMLESLVDGSLDVQAGGVLLADLHRRLHDLPALLSADATDRILHLDLHPGNVLLSPRGPVVIDWRNATEGPADLDLALSALILAEVASEKANPLASAASLLLSAFLESAGGDPLRMLSQAVEIRRADPALLGADAGLLGEAAGLISRSR